MLVDYNKKKLALEKDIADLLRKKDQMNEQRKVKPDSALRDEIKCLNVKLVKFKEARIVVEEMSIDPVEVRSIVGLYRKQSCLNPCFIRQFVEND